jgi:hypothetical protein
MEKTLTHILAAAIVLAALINGEVYLAAGMAGAAEARVIECQTSKGRDGYWAWREIDGRRCWYLGRAGKDKRLLTWSSAAPRVEPPPPIDPPQPAVPIPIVVPGLDFDGRWRCATRGC